MLSVDGAEVEPTGSGLLSHLCQAAAAPETSMEALADRLTALGEQVVLVVDSYERLRLIDAWVRRDLVPALSLGGLDDSSARRLASRAGITGAPLDRLVSLCRGHPLALRVATSAAARSTDVSAAHAATSVMTVLTATYLDELDPVTRRIVQAASVPRRVTRPLLAALLPEVAPQDAMDRLRGLPFVELTEDGLRLHEAVQHAIAGELARSDPDTSLQWRRRAWRHVRAEMSDGATAHLWRQTADMLWLIDNPVVREAFFPSGDTGPTGRAGRAGRRAGRPGHCRTPRARRGGGGRSCRRGGGRTRDGSGWCARRPATRSRSTRWPRPSASPPGCATPTP